MHLSFWLNYWTERNLVKTNYFILSEFYLQQFQLINCYRCRITPSPIKIVTFANNWGGPMVLNKYSRSVKHDSGNFNYYNWSVRRDKMLLGGILKLI